jgi:hypothetical protein
MVGDVASDVGNKTMGLQGPAIAQYMDDLVTRRMQIDNELATRATRRGLMSIPAGNMAGLLGAVTDSPLGTYENPTPLPAPFVVTPSR